MVIEEWVLSRFLSLIRTDLVEHERVSFSQKGASLEFPRDGSFGAAEMIHRLHKTVSGLVATACLRAPSLKITVFSCLILYLILVRGPRGFM